MPRKPPFFDNHPVRYVEALRYGLFRASCHYVSDGDTSDVFLDLGWYQYAYVSIRLADVDTCELRGTSGREHEMAEQARALAESLILDRPVLVHSHRVTTFERHVADIYCLDSAGDYPMLASRFDGEFRGTGRWVSLAEVLKCRHLTKADVPAPS